MTERSWISSNQKTSAKISNLLKKLSLYKKKKTHTNIKTSSSDPKESLILIEYITFLLSFPSPLQMHPTKRRLGDQQIVHEIYFKILNMIFVAINYYSVKK